jgi:hypothetical protein
LRQARIGLARIDPLFSPCSSFAMNFQKYLLPIGFSLCAATVLNAQSANSPMYTPATGSTGSILKKDIQWDSKVPLNKTYEQLTPRQRAELHSMYDTLTPGDEPPFPAEGIKPIFYAVRKAQRIYNARGEINLSVTVGPDGQAIKVVDHGSVTSEKLNQVAQRELMKARYKPAMCAGTPCTMQFEFRQKLGS